jgi:hypothetical protein
MQRADTRLLERRVPSTDAVHDLLAPLVVAANVLGQCAHGNLRN